MTRMIVPLDGSPRDKQAVGLGETLARALHGTIELLYVREPRDDDGHALDITNGTADAAYLALTSAEVDEGISVEQRLRSGRAAEQIVARATEVGDAIVVLADGPTGGTGSKAPANIANAVIQRAPVPVVVLRQRGFVSQRTFTHLLVPLDGSPLAESTLPVAADIAKRAGAVIRLVWVKDLARIMRHYEATVDPYAASVGLVDQIPRLIGNAARFYLQHTSQRLREQGIVASWDVLDGRAGEAINRAAWVEGADLILMATRGRSRLGRLALGSVTHDVLRDAVVPVLVLPPRARAWRPWCQGQTVATAA